LYSRIVSFKPPSRNERVGLIQIHRPPILAIMETRLPILTDGRVEKRLSLSETSQPIEAWMARAISL